MAKTKTKTVVGTRFDGETLMACEIVARVTADEKSTTISLSDDEALMLQVDFADIRELLEP